MSAVDLLSRMLRYQAWANEEMLNGIEEFELEQHAEERHAAIRMMNHCLVVNQIFAAHLAGEPHGFTADNTEETPELQTLRANMAKVDRWFLDYVGTVTPPGLSQAIPFTFTDGDKGMMTREEILTHVVTHGGYHRGEVGRLLKQAAARSAKEMKMPWDTYAVHLHRTEPERRLQGSVQADAPEAIGQ
ncbi:MAG: DinB family protein [Burkholderiales bacterium]|nr:DinB family protein [Burkholderiales bacterium]